ncbi:uncharacterized protein LOC132581651 isoform X2 [Heteronotia binoei]|nr:uncharacterized protein LOC132581651 isoform X2 [Heteronotia binoei]
MDNCMYWDSSGDDHQLAILAAEEKNFSSKYFVTVTQQGKVALRDFRKFYLATKPVGNSQPLLPEHHTPEASSEFKVFHKDNKIAFRAHNGCFLARVFREFSTIEASKTTVDSSCFFQPEIGDRFLPTYDVLNVDIGDHSNLKCRRCVLKKETYVNRSEEPVNHRFKLTWKKETIQTTVWVHRWGLGLATTADFTILDTEATLKYNEDNDKVVSVPKVICETLAEVVEVPPKTKATARLVVCKQDHVSVPFRVKIRKLKPGGFLQSFVTPGVWHGLVYCDLKLEIKMKPLRTPCTVM